MKRFFSSLLAIGLVAFTTNSFAAATTNSTNTNISPAERAKIESVVHDYLLKNPDLIVQVLTILQKKQYQEAEQTVKQTQAIAPKFTQALFHSKGDPVAGNPNGTITIVEFFDYQCPHCVDMAPVIDSIIKANPNVRVVYKEFPIRGPMSEFAALAALAANQQGKYYQFMHALLSSNSQLTQDSVYKIAQDTGLNVDELKKAMENSKIKDELKSNMKLAQDLKLFGTPALFIGKTNATGSDSVTYFPGQANQDQLQQMIDKANQ